MPKSKQPKKNTGTSEPTASEATEPEKQEDQDQENNTTTSTDDSAAEDSSSTDAEPTSADNDSNITDDDDSGEDEDAEDDDAYAKELLKKLRRKNSENASLRTRVKEAESKLLRYTVAAKKGLDLSVAARLQGSSKEELLKDADALLELMGRKPRLNSQPSDGVPRSGETADNFDAEKIAASLFTR